MNCDVGWTSLSCIESGCSEICSAVLPANLYVLTVFFSYFLGMISLIIKSPCLVPLYESSSLMPVTLINR